MSGTADVGTDQSPTSREEAERRRRRALERLGDILPDVTADETATGWGERDSGTRDEQLRSDVPPHHHA